MALLKPSLGSTPQDNINRIGAAFDVVDGHSQAIADEQTQRVAGIAAEAQARVAGIAAEAQARAAAVAAEGQARDAAVQAEGAARQQAIVNAVTAEGAARAAGDNALAALISRLRFDCVADTDRVGDAGYAFSCPASLAGLQGDSYTLPALPAAMRAFGDNGSVARLTGPGIIATRKRIAVEPGRMYRARWVAQRRANASDPSNDAVRFGIVWFDQAGNMLPSGAGSSYTAVADLKKITVSSGRIERQTTIGRQAGAGTLIVAPRNARFARLFAHMFGADSTTDIEVLALDDVSNATLLDPISSDTISRLTAVESQNLAPRIASLESAVQNPLALTFASQGDAASATIPAQVTTLSLRGRSKAGDGRGGDYVRVAVAPPAGQGFRTQDGAYWQSIIPLDLALAGQPTVADGGPSWAGYNRIHDTFRVAINDYPVEAQFGANQFGITEAIVGAVEIPAASDAGNHASGTAGYARSSSISQGGVGMFGGAFAGASGVGGAVSLWGANTLTSNCAHHTDPYGFTNIVAYGIELDFNIRKQQDGSDVNVPLRGLYFIGDSNTNGLGICNVIDVDQIGINQNVPWKKVIYTSDGAALLGFDLGANSKAKGSGSQAINLRSISADGSGRNGQIQVSPTGDLILTPFSGAGLAVIDTGGKIALQAANGLFKINLDGGVPRTVTYGAADSAGSGFRALRVPN
ncbi:hypothetical protein [Methylobacterium fujisawaense]|uniref:hypothetical protein n=1 Tax=Methylobacterium fujisawaense TaxID=107400 RepID=UPI00313F014E